MEWRMKENKKIVYLPIPKAWKPRRSIGGDGEDNPNAHGGESG